MSTVCLCQSFPMNQAEVAAHILVFSEFPPPLVAVLSGTNKKLFEQCV